MKRTKSDSDHTRAMLLDAADKLFGSRGYSRTTLLDVAREAGLTRGAMYWHFTNKADLFKQVLERMFSQVTRMIQDSMGMQGSPRYKIEQFIEIMIRMILEHPPYKALQEILLFRSEWQEELHELYQMHNDTIAFFEDMLMTLLGEGEKTGQLPSSSDKELIAASCFAFFSGLHLMKGIFAHKFPKPMKSEQMARFFISRILPPQETAQ